MVEKLLPAIVSRGMEEAAEAGVDITRCPLPARGGALATGSAAAAGYIGSGLYWQRAILAAGYIGSGLHRRLPRQPPPCGGLHRGGGIPSAASCLGSLLMCGLVAVVPRQRAVGDNTGQIFGF